MSQKRFHYAAKNSILQLVDQEIVSQIILAYSNGDTINSIKEHFSNIPLTNSLYANLPHELTTEKCVCGDYLYKKIEGRSAWTQDMYICANCGHNRSNHCDCDYCTQEKQSNIKREKERFCSNWRVHFESTYRFPVDIKAIDLIDQIHLITILSENELIRIEKDELTPKIFFSPKQDSFFYYPTENKSLKSFEALIDKQIIIPKSELNENQILDLRHYTNIDSIPYHKLRWQLNLVNDNHSLNLKETQEIISTRTYSEVELSFLWLELYHDELELYIQSQVKQYLGFYLSPIEVSTLTEALSESYPLSKAYYLVYFSVSSTLRYKVQFKPKEKNLRTYLLNKIFAMADEKKNDQHIIKDFNRPLDLKRSAKSTFISETVFKLPRSYFTFSKERSIQNLNTP